MQRNSNKMDKLTVVVLACVALLLDSHATIAAIRSNNKWRWTSTYSNIINNNNSSSSSSSELECPVAFSLIGDRCYFYGAFRLNWFRAMEFCHSFGGDVSLACIETQKESDNIKEWLVDNGDHSTGVWVGGSDNGHAGKWAWFPTGQLIRNFNWGPSQPSGGDQHCMYVVGGFLGYQWADFDCDFEMTFLCEDEVNPAVAWKKRKKKKRRKIEDGQLHNSEFSHQNFEFSHENFENKLESYINFQNDLGGQSNFKNSQVNINNDHYSESKHTNILPNVESDLTIGSDLRFQAPYSNKFSSSFIKKWGQDTADGDKNDDEKEQTFPNKRIHHDGHVTTKVWSHVSDDGKLIGGAKYDFPYNNKNVQKVETKKDEEKKQDNMWSLWSIVRRVKNVLALQ